MDIKISGISLAAINFSAPLGRDGKGVAITLTFGTKKRISIDLEEFGIDFFVGDDDVAWVGIQKAETLINIGAVAVPFGIEDALAIGISEGDIDSGLDIASGMAGYDVIDISGIDASFIDSLEVRINHVKFDVEFYIGEGGECWEINVNVAGKSIAQGTAPMIRG